MRVLIVDDDPISVLICTAMLKKLGIASEAAESVEKAKEILANTKPHLILLDLFMGREDGIDFLKLKFQGDVPVIMVSASTHFEAISACLQAGASSYLIKPIQPDLLQAAIKKLGLYIR